MAKGSGCFDRETVRGHSLFDKPERPLGVQLPRQSGICTTLGPCKGLVVYVELGWAHSSC